MVRIIGPSNGPATVLDRLKPVTTILVRPSEPSVISVAEFCKR